MWKCVKLNAYARNKFIKIKIIQNCSEINVRFCFGKYIINILKIPHTRPTIYLVCAVRFARCSFGYLRLYSLFT